MGPGHVVADRFEIVRLAGTGGSASVFRANDRQTGQPVALKVLRCGAEGEAMERFALEAKVLAQLCHRGIVRYVTHGKVGGDLFLAMEWLEGMTLTQRLSTQKLTVDEAVGVVRRVADALGSAHGRGVVHRDIKPGNIFLVDGDPTRIKLLDFGIARLRSSELELTQAGTLIGTPNYMAPEQARAEKGIDARADVFSLGCVLYRCLTGTNPFSGGDMVAVLAKVMLEEPAPIRSLRPEVPARVEELALKMLSKRRDDRPADGSAVRAALDELGLGPKDGAAENDAPTLTTDERRMMCILLARAPTAEWSLATGLGSSESALAAAVSSYGGRLDILADRSILVTLKEEMTPADDASRAARCALAMRSLIPMLAVALVAGARETQQRIAMGQVIDRGASLLKSIDARGVIRVDEVIAGFLDGRFHVRPEGKALSLVGELAEPSMTRTFLGRPSTCVGRERDLAMLEAIWAESADESVARIALLTGPAGIGKSRVLDELLRRVLRPGASLQAWIGRGDSMSARAPFGMIADTVRNAAGIRAGEPLDVRHQKIDDRVRAAVQSAHVARVTEFLAEVAGAPGSDDPSVELRAARQDPQLMGDQIRRAWEDWLEAETSKQPVLLVLEDLHWGDLPSVQLVDSAARHLEKRPFMVLALARPEVYTWFPGIWSERNLAELRVSRLGDKAAQRLVREALAERADDATIGGIVARGDGNPFFLEELVRAAIDGKGKALPTTVLAMVQARLGALSVEARRFLRAASVFGRVFPTEGVSALLGREGAVLAEECLTELVAKDVVKRSGDGRARVDGAFGALEFHHALIHEAAYSMLTEGDKALGHRLAAEWLERSGSTETIVLAEHFEKGGERFRAAAFYRHAAAQALGANDHAAAIQRGEKSLACGARGEAEGAVRLIESEARRWRGENERARDAARAAMQLLRRGSAGWCDAASELAMVSGSLGDATQLVDLATELEPVEPDDAASQFVNALARVARPLFWNGKHALGSRILARAGDFVYEGSAIEPTALASLYMARGVEARLSGDPSECVRWNERAVEESERVGDLRGGCVERGNLGYAYMEIGAYREAERTLTDALGVAARLGLPLVVATAQQNLGLSLGRLGAFERALHLERASLATFESQGDARRAGCSLLYLAVIEAEAGRIEEAEQTARQAMDRLARNAPIRCHALAVIAQILLLRGKIGPAFAAASEAHALFESLGGIDEGESRVRLVHAETVHACCDTADALAAMDVAVRALMARAAKIQSPEQRSAFLGAIPENARTLELARAWGVSA
ncbi:MAG: protein kinase [Polyangiaceae bacterium]|nr:protein kinase [Polyangiaceae bacterium]